MSDVEKNIGTHKPEFAGEWVKLGDVCAKGKSNLRQKDLKNDGPYPVYGASGIVGFSSDYQNAEAYVAVVKDGAGVGRVMACEPRSSVLGTMQALLPGKGTERDYLLHLVRSMDLGKGFTGSTIPHIYFKDYGKTLVRALSRRRQVEVANRLSGIDRLISQGKQQLSALDDLVKSQFVEMFGGYGADSEYRCARLGKLLSVEPQNGLYKPQRYYRTDCGGTPIVRVDAFSDGSVFSYASLKRLDCSESELENYALHEGDIVMNRVNGSIERVGKVALIKGLDEATVYESNMMRFHVDESRLNATYIVHVLCSDDIRKQIKSCARIANQCSVNQENIAELQIPLPPLALQQQFADFVARVDKLGFDVQQQIEKLETLKQSLMQEYFG